MINLIAAAFGIYAALVGGLYLFQRQLIYHPSQFMASPAQAGVAEMQTLSVTTDDGLALTFWYRPALPGQPTLVFFHGNGGNLSGRGFKARPYLDAGFGVVLAAYRGYGGNPGKPSETGLYADARAQLGFLRRQGVAPAQWVLYGESLGSGVAVQMAYERTAQKGLAQASDGQILEWQNPETGNSGIFRTIRSFKMADGRYCRQYRATVSFEKNVRSGVGMACRQDGGQWQVVSDDFS